jgi:DNA-binding MurR/RpiR family transcriptional regulator
MPSIRDRVKETFGELPPIQKRLIHEILEEYEEYIFLTVDEAARWLKAHKSTLVRLAQALGYDGYAEFRTDLQALYRQEVSPSKKLGRTLADIQPDDIYARVVGTEIQYLRESLKTVSSETIHKASQMLLEAKRIFICGKAPQNLLANLLEFRLRRFHLDVVAITEEGRAILEKLQLLEAEDVLLVISFNVFLKEHVDAIRVAKQVGCPVILLTDSVAKEMLEDVTLTIAARRGPATIYHTNIVPMAICSALVLDIARIGEDDVLASLERLHTLRRDLGYTGSLFHHGHLDTHVLDEDRK